MITQTLNQRMGSVSDNTASNSYSYIELSPENIFTVSREGQIEMLLKLRRSQEQSKRMLQALTNKPTGANDKQCDVSEILCETIKATRSHLKGLATLQCDADDILLETRKATRSHLRHLGAIARSIGHFIRN